jgi:predicted pyridoxine 5'-phosphate oxidase superfamily flavin-nucleotide-binding protein
MASGEARTELPEEVLRYLEGGRLVVAATVGDDGAPYTMVMNSVIALDSRTLRFALDRRTQTLKNLYENPAIMLEVIGDGFIYGVRGRAEILRETMEHAPVPSALVEVAVEAVKRDLPPGVIVEGPMYRWGALDPFMAPVEPPMFEELRTFGRS